MLCVIATLIGTCAASQFTQEVGGKCQTLSGGDPAHAWKGGIGFDSCQSQCSSQSDCFGFSVSSFGNCLHWLQSDIKGQGATWGNADCFIKTSTSSVSSSFENQGSGKCQTWSGEDPAHDWEGGIGFASCQDDCEQKANCFGFSVSSFGNCLHWMQQDIMGGGNSWGDADCILKIPGAEANAVTTTTTTTTPIVTTTTTTSPVGEWNIGSFGSCSVTCGEGVQTRIVSCSTGSASDCTGAMPSTTQPCNEQECPTTPNLKVAAKEAFDIVKLTTTTIEGEAFQRKFALPALIRKAFHDAGHFDHEIGEVRLGCIQHFLGNTMCPQHNHFEKAEDFREQVEAKLEEQNVEFSMADVVQLLGALAVDELAQTTGAELLYPKIRIGRSDSTVENCEEDMVEMCNNLPNFAVHSHSHGDCSSATTCDSQVTNALNAVWESEIEGKMMAVNTLTKVDAVSLIGAHTVGKHAIFGAWVTKPMLFDNDYWVQLQKLKQHLDNDGQFGQDQDHVYSKSIFNDWFQDSTKIDASPTSALFNEFRGIFNGEIMMLDSDLALILNAPEEVELYAEDLLAWRADFDAAYIKMGELGVTDVLTLPDASVATELSVGASRRTSKRATNPDEEAEFFQNLELLRQEQLSRANEIHAKAKQPVINLEDKPRQSLEAISVASTFSVQVFALIGLVSMGYFTVKCCTRKNEYKTISTPEY